VYHLPHLDSPALRKRKLRIFIDDDGLPGGDTHHYQLTRAFHKNGAKCILEDEEFGEAEALCRHLDGETAEFVRLARALYSRSLGPWCTVEVMSVDWMRALADALAVISRDSPMSLILRSASPRWSKNAMRGRHSPLRIWSCALNRRSFRKPSVMPNLWLRLLTRCGGT
jgi:hypothetical protein